MDDLINASNGFHWRDGWTFRRTVDGSVVMRQVISHNSGHYEIEYVVSPNEWASILASVCAKGETAETYHAAELFHPNEEGVSP